VVRRFNLADVFLVKRLQRQAACLDLETALLWSPAPLSLAIMEYLPLGQGTSATFVQNASASRPEAIQGFVQAWDRPDKVSCDVEFIAPLLDDSAAAFDLWCELLEHLAVARAASGHQRILARVPEEGRAVEAFRQAGFGAYARRRVFRSDRPQNAPTPQSAGFRPFAERDTSTVLRLRHQVTPRPVQHAEGGANGERDPTTVLPWWKTHHTKQYVWEEHGELRLHLSILIGQEGQWLTLVLDPSFALDVDGVLAEALTLTSPNVTGPVYCSVRGYQGGLSPALESAGFEAVASEVLMVKHTTARAKIAVNTLSPALEKGVETAAPISSSHRCEKTS
jgi:hypothetical protein